MVKITAHEVILSFQRCFQIIFCQNYRILNFCWNRQYPRVPSWRWRYRYRSQPWWNLPKIAKISPASNKQWASRKLEFHSSENQKVSSEPENFKTELSESVEWAEISEFSWKLSEVWVKNSSEVEWELAENTLFFEGFGLV